MAKPVVRQVRDLGNGTSVITEGEGGIGKIRCIKCKGATIAHKENGILFYTCQRCGTKFRPIKM